MGTHWITISLQADGIPGKVTLAWQIS